MTMVILIFKQVAEYQLAIYRFAAEMANNIDEKKAFEGLMKVLQDSAALEPNSPFSLLGALVDKNTVNIDYGAS
jgi:hypothetical protein